MATRSAIALQKGDTFQAIYCHWDGYPSHQLPILQTKYKTASAARALIAPGDLSSLETKQGWDLAPLPESRPLYYAERGEPNVSPRSFADLAELKAWADGCCCEHVYWYQPRKGWHHEPIQHEPIPAPMPGVDPAQW